MLFIPIEFGTPEYDQAVRLRHITLREPLGLEFMPEQLAEEYNTIHLAGFDDVGKLVAYLNLVPKEKGRVKMRQVAVDPALQGKGIGKKLVEYSEVFARESGYTIMDLHAREVVLKFYKSLKYKTVGNKFEEVGIPHYKMEKKLD